MSDFNLAIPTVIRHEGGYVNNPGDPGGATNFGISLRWLKSQGLLGDENHDMVVDIRDIQALTLGTAEAFYRVQWWDKYGFGRIAAQPIATKLFDTAVNVGTPRAIKFAQEAVNALGGSTANVDGQLGPNSISAINSAPAQALLQGMQVRQAAWYYNLVEKNSKLAQFLPGWLNRAYDRV